MSAALMSQADSPSSALSPVSANGKGVPLGASFERFAELQRVSARALLGFVLVLVLLLGLQVWRSTAAVERQRQLHGALSELNQVRALAEQAESALLTFRATGNSALLRSAQPCAGHCLAIQSLAQAVKRQSAAVAALMSRVTHWAGVVDAALLDLSREPKNAARGHDLADETVQQASRQLRGNLLALEADLIVLLTTSEARRYREAVLLQMLMGALVLVALCGLVLTMRRSTRLAAAGLLAEQALRELSLRDPLTGLPNRRALGMRLEHLIERAERHGGGPAVLALDLDGFKRINDFFGHAAGDAALVELAKRLAGVLRKSDLPARVGGDEFVVLLDDPESPETARAVGERLLLALRAPVNLPAPMGPIELGASVGLAHYPACGRTAQALLEAADAACYAAKHAGKNRLFESHALGVVPEPRAAAA